MFELKNNDSSWTIIKKSGKPVLVYGMGNGADKIIDELNARNIEICGVTASDGFVRGQMFRGFKVKKISDFEGDFIIVPAFGSSIPSVMENILNLYKKCELIYTCVPVAGNEIADEEFFEKNQEKIKQVYELLSDKSKVIYENILNFIYCGDLKYLLSATDDKDEIFTEYFNFGQNESYLDIGAYKGDTVDEFLYYTGGNYRKITAVEPDAKNFIKLKNKFEGKENIICLNCVCTDYNGVTAFASQGGRQSHISQTGKEIKAVTVDSLTGNEPLDYIKTDAEGEEMKIIEGAEKTIERCSPKLNIALYHKFSDMFEIPLKIHSINSEYKFEIRHHPYFPAWDTNLYCFKE